MAHSCPECDSACYCQGDIDDLVFDDTTEARRCSHCPPEGEYSPADDYDEDDIA